MDKAPANEKLLSQLTPHDRKLIEAAIKDRPAVTAAEAIEMCAEYGGMDISSPQARELLAKFS